MAKKFEAESFKKITLDTMMKYIQENHPEDKDWFKKIAFQDKDGNDTEKYNHLNAVRRFCEKYNKDLLPKKKEDAPTAKDKLLNW